MIFSRIPTLYLTPDGQLLITGNNIHYISTLVWLRLHQLSVAGEMTAVIWPFTNKKRNTKQPQNQSTNKPTNPPTNQ